MKANDALSLHMIKAILRRRHGKLLKWKPPQIIDGVGPSFPKVFNEYNSHVQAAIETSQETIGALTSDELMAAYDASGFPRTEAARVRETILKSEDNRLQQSEPAWFAGGFNVVGREADFKHWLRMKNWTLLEAVALSIGFEPNGDILEDNLGRGCQSQVGAFYQKRFSLFQDNFAWTESDQNDTRPVIKICEWMRDIDLETPTKLQEYASVFFNWPNPRGTGKSKARARIDPRERKTMLRLIIGLAKGGYSFDPDASRSNIPSEIGADLDLQGINLEQDTIRKYLREGAELLRNDLEETPDD